MILFLSCCFTYTVNTNLSVDFISAMTCCYMYICMYTPSVIFISRGHLLLYLYIEILVWILSLVGHVVYLYLQTIQRIFISSRSCYYICLYKSFCGFYFWQLVLLHLYIQTSLMILFLVGLVVISININLLWIYFWQVVLLYCYFTNIPCEFYVFISKRSCCFTSINKTFCRFYFWRAVLLYLFIQIFLWILFLVSECGISIFTNLSAEFLTLLNPP